MPILGIPEQVVLRQLQTREMRGYQLVQAMKAEGWPVIGLGEGAIYPVLYSLEETGTLKSQRRVIEGRSRVYYTIASKGVQSGRPAGRPRTLT